MITVHYSSIDRWGRTAKFKTIEAARKYAQYWIGAHPDIGSHYAISDDGIGKITVQGCSLAELFPEGEPL